MRALALFLVLAVAGCDGISTEVLQAGVNQASVEHRAAVQQMALARANMAIAQADPDSTDETMAIHVNALNASTELVMVWKASLGEAQRLLDAAEAAGEDTIPFADLLEGVLGGSLAGALVARLMPRKAASANR